MAGIKAIRDSAIDTATAAQLEMVSNLVRDVSARITSLLILADARSGADERRQLEDVAQDLRYALEYLSPQAPNDTRGTD